MIAEAMTDSNYVRFGKNIYNYSIVRTSRKTVGIIVEPDGMVIVKAPNDMNFEKITSIVDKKRKWIADKVISSQNIAKPIPTLQEPVSGEKILFKNQLYRLQIHKYSNARPKITRVCRTLHIYINKNAKDKQISEDARKVIIKWLKERAQNYLTQRVEKYSKYISQKPKDIKIRELKLRWGSCTKDGNLLFNWRIIMAPLSAIDYVVIHELCHLENPNHSADFWTSVESLLPSYKKWKDWLYINGRKLDIRF